MHTSVSACWACPTSSFSAPLKNARLVREPGDAARLFHQSLPEIAERVDRRLLTREWKPDEILRKGEETSACLTREGMRSIFYWDSEYPPLLHEITDPPLTLFLRGSLPAPGITLAAIVGTRFPTGAAREAAFRLGFELGAQRDQRRVRAGARDRQGSARGVRGGRLRLRRGAGKRHRPDLPVDEPRGGRGAARPRGGDRQRVPAGRSRRSGGTSPRATGSSAG